MRSKRFPVTTFWIKEWVELRKQEQPVPYAEIAAKYGVCAAIVHRYVTKEIGLTPTRVRLQKFSRKEAKRLEDLGWTRTAIAKELGVTAPAITQALGPKQSAKHDPWQHRREAA